MYDFNTSVLRVYPLIEFRHCNDEAHAAVEAWRTRELIITLLLK